MNRFAVCLPLLVVIAMAAYAVQPPPVKPAIKSSGGSAPQRAAMTELPILKEEPAVEPQPPPQSDTVKNYRDLATAASAKGDWPSAEEHLRSALRLDPQNAEVVLELSRALTEQGKEDGALAVLVGYSGPDARVTQALGEAYVSSGRLKEAEQVFIDLSLRQPGEAYHRYNLALVEARMGKNDMAENAYLRAIDLDPAFSDARYNLALLYIRNRDLPKALTQLEEAVRLKEDPDYLVNYGVVLREMKRLPASQAALERALDLDRGNALALNNLGITHYLAGNRAAAQKAFTEVLNVLPEDATARSFLSKMTSEPLPSPSSKEAPAPLLRDEEPESPMDPQIHGDVDRLQQENTDLKEQLQFLEARMDEIKKGMYDQMSKDEKSRAQRVDQALKKAQDKLEKKEKELAKKSAARSDAGASTPPAASGSGSESSDPAELDARMNDLQKTLAQTRLELEEVRSRYGPVTFSSEPGSTEDRLNAADRAVQQLQRQIRQLIIERDMLRTEVDSMRPGGPGPALSRDMGRTNINMADLNLLLLIPGMEERLAHNILWYRQNIGAFKSVNDLKKVPGMDDAHYTQMLDYVTAGPESSQ